MTKTLSDFTIERTFGKLDIPKLLALSDDDFLEIHQNNSRQYLTNHGSSPVCQECKTKVTSHLNHVRFYGVNLHNSCFKMVYNKEMSNIDDPDDRRYWNRLESLI